MTPFWRTWLDLWCGAVMVFGLVLVGAAFEPTRAPLLMLLGPMNPAVPVFDDHLRFAYALMGAVTLAWGLTFLAALRAAAQLSDRALWRGLTVAVLAWYVIDGALSAATGFALNIVPNTALLAGYLIPVLATGVLSGGALQPAE